MAKGTDISKLNQQAKCYHKAKSYLFGLLSQLEDKPIDGIIRNEGLHDNTTTLIIHWADDKESEV